MPTQGTRKAHVIRRMKRQFAKLSGRLRLARRQKISMFPDEALAHFHVLELLDCALRPAVPAQYRELSSTKRLIRA